MSDLDDKTVRLNNVPEGDNEATVRINQPLTDDDATVRIDNIDDDATVRMDATSTDPAFRVSEIPKFVTNPLAVEVDEKIILNSKEYYLVKAISVKTGEAYIYLIRDEKQNYVLKLYNQSP